MYVTKYLLFGCLGCFSFFTVINNTARNTFMGKAYSMCNRESWNWDPWVRSFYFFKVAGVSVCAQESVIPLAFIGAASNSHSLRELRLVVLQLELRWNHAEGTSTWLPGPRPTVSVQWASGGAWDSAFLTRSQVMLILLLQGPQWEPRLKSLSAFQTFPLTHC